MESFLNFERFQCLCSLLILYRRSLIMQFNDEDIADNPRFLYAVMFANRIAETICEMRQIFDAI